MKRQRWGLAVPSWIGDSKSCKEEEAEEEKAVVEKGGCGGTDRKGEKWRRGEENR